MGRIARSSRAHQALEAAIADRFGDVLGGDPFAPGEVGDRSGDACEPIDRAGGKLSLCARAFEEFECRAIERAERSYGGRRNIGVRAEPEVCEPSFLPFARGEHPHAYLRGRFRGLVTDHIIERHARDLDLQIDSVEERPGEFVRIPRDRAIVAAALGITDAAKATGAGTRCPFAIRPAAPESGEAEDN